MKAQLILFFTLIGFVSTNAQSLNIPLVNISEKHVAYAKVDEIHFTVNVQSYAKDVTEARAKNKQIAADVFRYLEGEKVPKQYIQTKRMIISRNYTNRRPPMTYDGFYANQVIYVCLKDINKYDQILDALLEMEVSSVNGPNFKSGLYEETIKNARLEALKKAKKSASDMAEALGQSIGKAKLINTVMSYNNSNSAYSTQSTANTDFQSNGASFEVGEIEVTATVEVSFELLDYEK